MLNVKNNISSEQFNDGILYICKALNDGTPDYAGKCLYYFGLRNLTAKRQIEAAQVQAEFNMVVQIPLAAYQKHSKDDYVIVRDAIYQIVKVEEIYTTKPPIAVLSLQVWEMNT